MWLADVPFVRLRELFPKQLGRYPGTFSALVQTYSRQIDELAGPPEVLVDVRCDAVPEERLPAVRRRVLWIAAVPALLFLVDGIFAVVFYILGI